MKKTMLVLMLSLLTSVTSVLASGYGGYDDQYYEVGTIEIKIKGELKPSCTESDKTIAHNLTVSNCYDKWIIEENCECIAEGSDVLCEQTKVIGCTAEVSGY